MKPSQRADLQKPPREVGVQNRQKILNFLKSNPNKLFTVAEVSNAIDLCSGVTRCHLHSLNRDLKNIVFEIGEKESKNGRRLHTFAWTPQKVASSR